MGRKYIIKVDLPGGRVMSFTTSNYTLENNRIKFLDKYGASKDFPQESVYIEESSGSDFND